jgi:hypothetical protein
MIIALSARAEELETLTQTPLINITRSNSYVFPQLSLPQKPHHNPRPLRPPKSRRASLQGRASTDPIEALGSKAPQRFLRAAADPTEILATLDLHAPQRSPRATIGFAQI